MTASALAVVVLILWQLLATASPAAAHAVLVSSNPEDGARLAKAPAQVTFTFDEAVQLPDAAATALSDNGSTVSRGPAHAGRDGRSVIVPIQQGLPDGAYTVSYRVVSADGHVVTGAIRFGVNADPGVPTTIPQPRSDPLETVRSAAQGAEYLGLVLLIGTTAALLVVWRREPRSRIASPMRWVGWVLLVGGTLLRLLLAGPVATASGWPGVFRLSGLSTTVHEEGGIAGLVRVALLVLALPWVVRPSGGPRRTALGCALVGGVLVSVAVDGHSAVGSDSGLAVSATVIHLAAMSIWIGGLLTLVVFVLPARARPALDRSALRRWATVAFASVAALILTGEYLAWRQIDPLPALFGTAYGATLVVKLALFAIAILFAIASHVLLARRGPTIAPRDQARARWTVAVEATVTILVVVTTTLLVSLPPARTTYGPRVTLTAPAGPASAVITVDPTHTGPQRISVRMTTANGAPPEVRSVTGTLGTDSVAGVRLSFTRGTSGTWSSPAIAPIAGQWTVQVNIDLGDDGTYATSARYRVWG